MLIWLGLSFLYWHLLPSWIWLLAAAVLVGAALDGWPLSLRDAWLMALLDIIAASPLIPWNSPRGAVGRRPLISL